MIKDANEDILQVTNAETTAIINILERVLDQLNDVGNITVIPKQVSRHPKGR